MLNSIIDGFDQFIEWIFSEDFERLSNPAINLFLISVAGYLVYNVIATGWVR